MNQEGCGDKGFVQGLTMGEVKRFLLAAPKEEVLDLVMGLEEKHGPLGRPPVVYQIHLLDFGETWIRVIRVVSNFTGESLSAVADEITIGKIPYIFGPFSAKEKCDVFAQALRDAGALVQVVTIERGVR